jgi:predicted PurR-regulated permease PerM
METDRLRAPIAGTVLRWGALAWALIGILALAYVFVRYLFSPLSVIFAPIVFAAIIVYLLKPVVNRLARWMPRAIAVAIVFIAFVGTIVLALSWLIPMLVNQISSFVDQAPEYTQRVVDRLNEFAEARGFDWRVSVTSEDIVEFFQSNREQIVGFLGGLGNFATQIVHLTATLVIGMILSIYVLVDLPGMTQRMHDRIPQEYRDEVRTLGERITSTLGGFFRGQLLVASFVGVLSAAVLSWPVKLPFAVLVGVLAGIFNLVPLIGPFLAMIPAAALGLLSDRPITALWAIIALAAVQQIDNHIVSPNVMGRSVQLHPITVMLALLVGGTIAGIVGMLITIPIIATVKIVTMFLWHRQRHMFTTGGSPPVPV